MLLTLSYIGESLENENITWGVGGSLLLSFYQLIDKPNDIDILVTESNAAELNEIMLSIGKPKEAKATNPFRTTIFSKYTIDDIGIDIMGGFAVQHNNGVYRLVLQQDSIVDYKKINGVNIPLCSLEDWYILYWLIPNKQEKAILIENYLRTTGVKNPKLLEKALKQPLPLEVKVRIMGLLKV